MDGSNRVKLRYNSYIASQDEEKPLINNQQESEFEPRNSRIRRKRAKCEMFLLLLPTSETPVNIKTLGNE